MGQPMFYQVSFTFTVNVKDFYFCTAMTEALLQEFGNILSTRSSISRTLCANWQQPDSYCIMIAGASYVDGKAFRFTLANTNPKR